MNGSTTKILVSCLAILSGIVALPARAEDGVFIAGVAPDRRPVSAPKVMVAVHPQAWYAHAVHGIVQPYPQSLFFLDNQGDWYTPFNRPGMPDRYDIRDWFKKN